MKEQQTHSKGEWMTPEEFDKRTAEEIDTSFAKNGWADPNELTVIVVPKGSHPARGR